MVAVIIPALNEAHSVGGVVAALRSAAVWQEILVIDDGSTDRTPSLLAQLQVDVVRHGINRGYGRSLRDAFSLASCRGYDAVITMDCDEQHEPGMIPVRRRSSVERVSTTTAPSRWAASASSGFPPASRQFPRPTFITSRPLG